MEESMARRRTLTDAGIASLKARAKTYAMPDPEMPGHYIRVHPTGSKMFVVVARNPSGKQVWATIGSTHIYRAAEARQKARGAIRCIREGLDRVGPDTFERVSDTWLKRHVEAKKLISAPDLRSMLERHLLPAWRNREFVSIRRGDVATLLDKIEDSNGAVVADFALATIRMICNFHATRSDDYVSPAVKGMRRTDPKAHARARILNDEELSLIWKAAESNGTFGAFIQLALLTAQRREKVAAIRWEDVSPDGEWTIPSIDREKSTAGSLQLPQAAMEIINAQPRFKSNPYIFAGNGTGYLQPGSKQKARFDAKLPAMPNWTVHDLRRTARSLMSRAGVRPDVAERVLGHAIQGVEGVYDRHSYRDEKKHALAALAGLIDTIVNPTPNVVAMRG
jgi:integrase